MTTTHPPAKPRRLGFLALLPGLFAFAVFNVMTWAQARGMTHDQPAGVRSTRIRELDAWGMGRFLPPYIFCTAKFARPKSA